MFNLPEDIQRYIYEFCSDKWQNMDKVLNQFLKGGFNRINYKIKNFVKNEKKIAKNVANFKNSRKSKVTKWLRNIERFENTHPEVATYLSKKELEKNFKIALKRREEIKAKKLHIKNEHIRARELYDKCKRDLKQQFLTEYFYGQELRLPINPLRPNKNWTNHTWEEDETIDCDICTCKIDSVYGKIPGYQSDYRVYWTYQKMRFNEKWIKQHIELNVELKFNNGCVRRYNVQYFKQRIELSKHYGVENTQIWTGNGEELELDIIEIKNCKYIYDEKGIYTGVKNLLLNMETEPIGIYNKKTAEIYFCEFEE
jgi:hypothetical protein